MTRYEVDVPAVDGLSTQVSAVGVEVRAALGRLRAADCVDAGDADLSAALRAFGQLWSTVTEASAQPVDATAGAIAAAAAAHVHVDESVVADLAVTSAFVHEVVWLDTTEQGAALGSGVLQREQD